MLKIVKIKKTDCTYVNKLLKYIMTDEICPAGRKGGVFMKKSDLREVFRNLALASQFGISFISPLLLCVVICWWLTSRAGLGGWIYIPGFFFGLGGSFSVAYKLYLTVTGQLEKEKKEKKHIISFNKHH